MRRGFSLHELLVSLSVMGVVFALATHFAVRHMRFFRHVGDVAGVRAQLGQVTEIVRSVLSNVAPASGELLVAQDSALELRLLTGTSFVCSGTPGVVVVPAPGGADGESLIRAARRSAYAAGVRNDRGSSASARRRLSTGAVPLSSAAISAASHRVG